MIMGQCAVWYYSNLSERHGLMKTTPLSYEWPWAFLPFQKPQWSSRVLRYCGVSPPRLAAPHISTQPTSTPFSADLPIAVARVLKCGNKTNKMLMDIASCSSSPAWELCYEFLKKNMDRIHIWNPTIFARKQRRHHSSVQLQLLFL